MKVLRPTVDTKRAALTQKGGAAKKMHASDRDRPVAAAKGAAGRRDASLRQFVLKPVSRQGAISQSQADKAVRDYLSKR